MSHESKSEGVASSGPALLAEDEVRRLGDAEKQRLLREAGLVDITNHYRRPAEQRFLEHERPTTTILIGNLTWKHDALIKAVFEGNGYRAQSLPCPNLHAFQTGRAFINNGLCNPCYFTGGVLIDYLKGLEASGLSRAEIVRDYVYFTAGSCGPCRFGMYESEYRAGLINAGYEGFRVLTFQNSAGINQKDEAGLKYTMDFGLGMLNALFLGDAIHETGYILRPYEIEPGKTDWAINACIEEMGKLLRERRPFEFAERGPRPLARRLRPEEKRYRILNNFGKFHEHLYGEPYKQAIRRCREILGQVQVDRLRVKPVVKSIGEFWSNIAEGDANFNMYPFLEGEGAQVLVDPISSVVTYWLHQPRRQTELKAEANPELRNLGWRQWRRRAALSRPYWKKQSLLWLGEVLWRRLYNRTLGLLGHIVHPLIPQDELWRLAAPYYNPFLRGGEGHLEVAKSIYYTEHHLAHMILSLKPFGCLPSTQSDGVHSAVVAHHPDMIFLSIETSGEGEVNAHSRVQMALGDAKRRAREEFDKALATTGKTLDEIRDFAGRHPALRHPFYPVPHSRGIAGIAANFVLHVGAIMDGRSRLRKLREML